MKSKESRCMAICLWGPKAAIRSQWGAKDCSAATYWSPHCSISSIFRVFLSKSRYFLVSVHCMWMFWSQIWWAWHYTCTFNYVHLDQGRLTNYEATSTTWSLAYILDLWCSDSASPTLPSSLRAWVTSFQVTIVDFWSQTSSTALRQSSFVSLMVKISSSRSSSILSSSPSFFHCSTTVGCSSVKRVSRVRGLLWQATYSEEWGGKGWKICNDTFIWWRGCEETPPWSWTMPPM